MTDTLAIGTRVMFPYYDLTLVGRVTRDNGNGIVWVRPEENGRRERWVHRESLTVLSER